MRKIACAVACALLTGACRATWTPMTVVTPQGLQWPYAPHQAKVVHVESLVGLKRERDATALLRTIAFGNVDDDLNRFVLPVAIATARDGRMAVADMGRKCVHMYLPAAKEYLRLTGSEKDPLVSPVALVFDDALRLYVSDSSGKVFAFDENGAVRFVLRKAGAGLLQRPTGIAYSPSKTAIYVADTLAHAIDVFSAEGTFLFAFGARGAGVGELNFPTHLTRSSAGELYVTDALNFRVAIFDENGRALGFFGHHGDGSGDMAMPKGVAVDGDGVVYVADALFDNVQLFSRGGAFLLNIGERGTRPGEFWLPSGAFISDRGYLYVCDTYNHRIQVFRVLRSPADGFS